MVTIQEFQNGVWLPNLQAESVDENVSLLGEQFASSMSLRIIASNLQCGQRNKECDQLLRQDK